MVEDRHTVAVARSFQQLVDSASAILREENAVKDSNLQGCFSLLIDQARSLMSTEADRSQERLEREFRTFVAKATEALRADEQAKLGMYAQSLARLRSALKEDIEAKVSRLQAALDQAKEVYDRINLFSILRMQRQEDPQSYFLAWLLDPKGSHNLGDAVLVKFLERACDVVNDCRFNDLKIENISVTLQQPTQESGVPDIEIEGENFICAIENKVLAGETITHGTPQTVRYAKHYDKRKGETGKHIILLYLVPNEAKRPVSNSFKQILYSDVSELVRSVAEEQNLQPEVKCLIDMFLYNIRKEICRELADLSEAEELLQKPRIYFYQPEGYERLTKSARRLSKEETESD